MWIDQMSVNYVLIFVVNKRTSAARNKHQLKLFTELR